jgi:hypothetical protein
MRADPEDPAMAFTMEFVDQGRGIQFTGSGELTGAEMIAPKHELLAQPERVRALRFAIVSLIDVTRFEITTQQVHEIAALDRKIGEITPAVAVVVIAPRTHDFGMARMWETILDVPGWSSAVVRTRQEADAWLAPRVAASATERSQA